MAKSSGLGDRLLVGSYDLSGDTQSINQASGGPALIDVTSIDRSAMERIGGRRDGRLEATSFFNPATDRAHPVLSALPTGDVIMSYLRGAAVGNAAASLVAKQINYDGTRGNDGEFTFDVAAEANRYGLQWGYQQTAGVHDATGAATLGEVTFPNQTVFGAQMFLHVTEFTGTSADIKVEDSTGGGWVDLPGGAFTTVTGIGSERIATTATETVDRFTRLDLTGTFTSISFAVVLVRNETAVAF